MRAEQPITCPTCQGVLVAMDPRAYTLARGRLIVTNGFCRGRCEDERPAAQDARAQPAPPAHQPARAVAPATSRW